jgi:nitroreductase
MQTWDAIRARRNVRQYTDQPIAREDLERILEAGRRAPSSQNWQPTATEGPAAGFPRSAGPAR